MTGLALPFPSGRGAPHISFLRWIGKLFAGISEGATLAGRYRMLAYKSDEELAELGLKRSELARAVVLGKKR